MNTVVKKEEKKDAKIIYPDQLNITIRTSVPGYQKIEYKPSMTIKNSDEKAVKFNPLIKLNKSKINTIPEEYRIKEFFNKGLFQSLLNYNGGIPAKSLAQATQYGYVDNNIKVTLDSIFPVGSIIYIGKNPYAIGDIQWTTGDWKIEIKQKKEEIDPSKITEPKLYTQLVKEEIISGEQQLNQIPAVILTGVNYTGPPIAAAPPPVVLPLAAAPPAIAPQAIAPQAIAPQAIAPQAAPLVIRPPPAIAPKAGPLVIRPPPAIAPKAGPPPAGPQPERIINDDFEMEPVLPPPQLQPQIEDAERLEELSPEEERLYDSFKRDIQVNIFNTNFFRKYFQTTNYFNLIKIIFNYSSSQLKETVNQFYYITTNIIPKKGNKKNGISSLSKTSYNTLCDLVSILKSPMDGDCFFKAVADGINIHNYENQNSKIVYNNYGINNLFTIKVLREIVFRYIRQLDDVIINNMLLVAQEHANTLNEKFGLDIDEFMGKTGISDITGEQYLDIANNVYHSDINFFVKKPESVPKEFDLYYSPFRVITKQEIQQYILSKNYWANDIAINAICYMLKLSIIPIEKYDYESRVRLSVKKVKTIKIDRLKTLIPNNELTKDECPNKIMFLLYKNNHYELIRFKYLVKPKINIIGQGIKKQQQIEYIEKLYTIFNNNDLAPPIHILLLIYGTSYSTIIDKQSKNNFSIYLPIMKQIDNSCIKIMNLMNSLTRDNFIKLFNYLFPNNRPIQSILIQQNLMITAPDGDGDGDGDGDVVLPSVREANEPLQMVTRNISQIENPSENIIGGQYRYPPSYGYPPYYGYPRPGYITKKPDDSDASKIAYSIIIDMELHPGTSLTPQQISESKCNTKYNAIRKAFAEFTGRPYVIPPVYNKTIKNKNASYVPVETKNNQRFDNTRRKAPPAGLLGGKTRKHKY